MFSQRQKPDMLTWGEEAEDSLPDLSPDGRLLLYYAYARATAGQTRLMDFRSRQILGVGGQYLRPLGWAPDSRHWLALSGNKSISVFDRSGNPVGLPIQYRGMVDNVEWLNEDHFFFSDSWTHCVGDVGWAAEVYSLRQQMSRTVLEESRLVAKCVLSPDRKRLLLHLYDWDGAPDVPISHEVVAVVTIDGGSSVELGTTRANGEPGRLQAHGWSPDATKVLL